MKVVAIIPVRMAASRFPGKPLFPILGLPMVEHVRRRVSMNKNLEEVIVATCDKKIKDVVVASGGKVVMTANTHERCTDRVSEAAAKVNADIVINVQGDEPLVTPKMIDDIIHPFTDDDNLHSVNLVTRISDPEEFKNPNALKVVTNIFGDALYISREPIPSQIKASKNDYIKLKQLGLIAFKKNFLHVFTKLNPTPLEKIESVDMMRAVEYGYRVKVVITKSRMIAVDVPEDISKVETVLRNDPLLKKYL